MSGDTIEEDVKHFCLHNKIHYIGSAKIGRDLLIWIMGDNCGDKVVEYLDNRGISHTTPKATRNGIGLYITGLTITR